ncbi:hypothetical protein EVA_04492 [gut metagenome]|uniref:Uncharacterized protein n=1 Tax=gut metagenome TaxID=749906 RepID=J9GJH6_9ZZZZ
MQNQRNAVGSIVDLVQSLKVKALPVCGILAVDVADPGCQKVNAQRSDATALGRICNFTASDNAVFFAADGADLCLDRQTPAVSQFHQFSGLCDVLIDGVVATVEHDAGETSLDAGFCTFVGTMVQMQSHRDGDTQIVDHGANHGSNGLKTGHVLAGTLGNTENYGAVQLLSGEQDCFGPLQIVDVELPHGVVTVTGLVEHFSCAD